MFNTADKYGIENTPAQDEAAAYLQSILVNFARDPVYGLAEMGFPEYEPTGNNLVQLVKGSSLVSFNASTGYDGAC